MSKPVGTAHPVGLPKYVSPLCPDQNPLQLRHASFEAEWHRRCAASGRFLDYPGAPTPPAPRFADDYPFSETGGASGVPASAAGAGHRGEAGTFMT